jgi:hypothetical protein
MTWTLKPNYDSYLPTTKDRPALFKILVPGDLFAEPVSIK